MAPAAVSASMARSYELAFLAVPFGRKELEEYLVLRYRTHLFNKPTKRLVRGEQYTWVRPAPG